MDNVIYDSTGEEYSIAAIFDQFDNQNCPSLCNKPKLYFVDACRGDMRTKRFKNHNTNDKINNNNNNDEKKAEFDDSKINIVYKGNDRVSKADVENGKTKKKQDDEKNNDSNSYLKDSHCRKIFANTSGYAAVDGGVKGGYLIRSVIKVVSNPQSFRDYDLDGIVRLTRQLLENLIGSYAAQVVEDVNTMPYRVKFQHKQELKTICVIFSCDHLM